MKIIIALILLATAARAAPTCVPSHDIIAAALKEQFGETVQMIGALPDGRPFEVFGNRKTGTWTAVIVLPDGRACFPASGTSLALVPPGDPA